MRKFLAFVSALLGFGGAIYASEPVTIQNADDHNRVYKAAWGLIEPYIRSARPDPTGGARHKPPQNSGARSKCSTQ